VDKSVLEVGATGEATVPGPASLIGHPKLAGTRRDRAEVEDLDPLSGDGELEWFGWFVGHAVHAWEEVRQGGKHIIPECR
jgi:hypothetical protein